MSAVTVVFSDSSSASWHLTTSDCQTSNSTAALSWTLTMEHQARRLWRDENPLECRPPTDPELEPFRERVARNA